MRTFLRALCSCVLGASTLSAQAVRGAVVARGTNQPVGGAVVLLLDAKGAQVAGTLSDSAGRFLLKAPAPGTYTLRIERTGLASVTTPALSLAAGQTMPYQVAASLAPVTLPTVTVSGAQRCIVRPDEGAEAFTLWNAVRSALDANAITQQQHRMRVTLREYERDLDPRTQAVTREQQHERSGFSATPFVSLPAAQLASGGYVQTKPDGATWYYAPDASVLLSDAFLDTHCLRPEQGSGDTKGLIGLAFEPSSGRKLPDVRGVLWLDPKTDALRSMDFSYTGLHLPPPITQGSGWATTAARGVEKQLGGHIEFRQMPTGAWIIQRWSIKTPIITVSTDRFRDLSGGRADADASEEQRTAQALSGIHEVGGEVLSSVGVAGGAPGRRAERATITGTVFDSSTGAPMPGAKVFLSGTEYATVSGDSGRFTLSGLPAGRYTIALTHPRLDSLGVFVPGRDVAATLGDTTSVALAVPSLARQAATRLARRSATRDTTRTSATPTADANAPMSKQVAVLHTVHVTGQRRTWLEGFEQRRAGGNGIFLDRKQIEQRSNGSATDLFRGLPGIHLQSTDGFRGGASYVIQIGRATAQLQSFERDSLPRSGTALTDSIAAARNHRPDEPHKDPLYFHGNGTCAPAYFLDGRSWVPGPGGLDEFMRPEDIEAIEIYRGPAETPPQFMTSTDAHCGVIVIWTRRTAGR
jgi:hypothetical protein